VTDALDIDVDVAAAWVFERGEERLTITRQHTADAWELIVDDGRHARLFTFTDSNRLVRFQSDMETFLVRTGWSLAGFSPERRRGRDRRGFPRELNGRRRWWTDVPPDKRKPL
jgi:hypothetical protein